MEQKRCYGCMKRIESEQICEHCGYDQSKENEIHQLAAGTILKEQYMIGKVLGQGGFGITYLGWDMYLDIPVAIKEYFPSGTVMREASVSMEVLSCSGDEGARFQNNKERFMREAKMLARFSEVPEIVQIKNFFLANNTAYIVMEYVQGITLKEYVKNQGGKLSLDAAMEIIKPVMQALCKVHKAGLVHRDISPDNIMMLPNGRAKLLDFGAVRDVGNADVDKPLTKSTEAILKQGYAPIEQYQNRGSLGPWTDVYALCATIYYCLTGAVPPDAPERLLGDDTIDFQTLVPEMSKEQADVLTQGMALRATERISSMDELFQRLFEPAIEDTGTDENVTESVSDTAYEFSYETSAEKSDGEMLGEKKKVNKPNLKTSYVLIGVLAIAAIILIIGIAFPSNTDSPSSGNASSEGDSSNAPNLITGTCGENAGWEFDTSTGKLTITGEGEIYDFNGTWQTGEFADEWAEDRELPPWTEYREEIQSLEIGDEITVIGENAFENCNNLKEVKWGSGLQEIRWQAFLATGIERVEFSEGIVIIRSHAFNWCVNLQTVILPESLELLEAWAFSACEALTMVQFADSNTVLHITEDGQTPFTIEDTDRHPAGLTIQGYTGSVAEAFARDMDLPFTSIGISENSTLEGQCGDDITWRMDIENNTLYLEGSGQTWLYRISEEDRNDWGADWPEEWLQYGRPGWYLYRNYVEHIVIGEGITSLNHRLFEDMENLKTVDFGTVEEILCTFTNCNIEEIIFPESMHIVGAWGVAWCPQLRKVTILNGSSSVGEGLFAGCTNLEEVYFSRNAVLEPDLFDRNGDGEYSQKVIFYVYEGSDAERYAIENQIPYKIRSE